MKLERDYDIESYHYDLPEENIAQQPAARRDDSRLLVIDGGKNRPQDLHFPDILKFLQPDDLLVVNNTRVFPARLMGRKETGGRVELLLLEYPRFGPIDPVNHPTGSGHGGSRSGWSTASALGLLRSSKRPRIGGKLLFNDELEGVVDDLLPNGTVRLTMLFRRQNGRTPDSIIARHGKVPLPPYIHREQGEAAGDRDRYQTLFAERTGAVAAPTAGLHFSDTLLAGIKKQKVNIAAITLHVGYGTFAPVRVKDIRTHRIHEEYLTVPAETATLINETRAAGGRVWAVGTTTTRALEFAVDKNGKARAWDGWCDLYIYPGYQFRIVNNLITNFHLPRSSLLFLVAALTGRERLLMIYREAVRRNYRFYSYGDAMTIIT